MGLSSMESLGPTWPEVQSVRILLFFKKRGLPCGKKIAAENGKHGQAAVLR